MRSSSIQHRRSGYIHTLFVPHWNMLAGFIFAGMAQKCHIKNSFNWFNDKNGALERKKFIQFSFGRCEWSSAENNNTKHVPMWCNHIISCPTHANTSRLYIRSHRSRTMNVYCVCVVCSEPNVWRDRERERKNEGERRKMAKEKCWHA